MVVFDVIEEILVRSDVKDLIRYKSVCKSWYSLISSPFFVKAHLKNNNDSGNTNNKEVGHTRIAMPKYWKIANKSLYKYNQWKVVGSSNGLVCISPLGEDNLILVCNPWTREIRKLPMAPLVTEEDKDRLCLSFGYDSSTDDYKVLLAIRKSPDGTVGGLFLIFSMKSDTWKLIGQFSYWFWHTIPGIFFNGALHWFGFDFNTSERKKLILSFDLSREEFIVIPQPNDSKYVSGLTILGIVEGQLCIFYINKDNDLPRDIWVMRNYNVEQSWELLPPNDYEMKHEVVHFMKMIHYASPMKNRMSFFCDDNKSLLKAWDYICAHRFVPSLLSPYVNIGKPSHQKNSKTSVKAWGDMTSVKPRSIERTRSIEESYRLEVGETDNLYLYKDGV